MCGISGYLDTERGVNVSVLRRMTDVIRYRGPDDEGYVLIGSGKTKLYGGKDTMGEVGLPLLDDAHGTAAFLGLGHRRLSILDLSVGGHQPMYLPDRDITLTYNGELYNYVELRAELESLGYGFRTHSDTEVLLYAYCAWGEDCLSHFNGMWGFALWDGRENKLFCARDRLGAKPFHYYRDGNHILFGSELKQLCQDDTIVRRFDQPYLAANLMYRISDYNDRTLIENMRVLRPGHKLVVQLNTSCTQITSMTVSPYWTLQVHYDDTVPEEQWDEKVAEEFSRSCRWRMRSDAPLGALLSGGLDSSCMVAEMCSQMADPKELQTFTTSYPGDKTCDEWHYANLVNQSCGCMGNQIIPDPDQLEKRYEEIIWHVEGLAGLPLIGVKYLLDVISGRGIKVILNGQCGDEIMLGYERYYAFFFSALLRSGQLGRICSEFGLANKHSKLTFKDLIGYAAYFNIAAVRNQRQWRRATQFVHEDLLQQRDREELQDLLYPRSLEKLQYNELTATQLQHIVRFDDRLYMSASLESRIPFMDYRFVELACRIPPKYKIQKGYTKYLMRKVFAERLPKEVIWRTNKMGFGAPVSDWAQQFSKEYLLDNISNAKTAQYFKRDSLEAIARNNQFSQALFDFLAVEQFAQKFQTS